jgi:hypothetical protein
MSEEKEIGEFSSFNIAVGCLRIPPFASYS